MAKKKSCPKSKCCKKKCSKKDLKGIIPENKPEIIQAPPAPSTKSNFFLRLIRKTFGYDNE
jgi:hypothetical protein